MTMTRETKLGVGATCTFACLVSCIVGFKLYEDPPDDSANQDVQVALSAGDEHPNPNAQHPEPPSPAPQAGDQTPAPTPTPAPPPAAPPAAGPFVPGPATPVNPAPTIPEPPVVPRTVPAPSIPEPPITTLQTGNTDANSGAKQLTELLEIMPQIEESRPVVVSTTIRDPNEKSGSSGSTPPSYVAAVPPPLPLPTPPETPAPPPASPAPPVAPNIIPAPVHQEQLQPVEPTPIPTPAPAAALGSPMIPNESKFVVKSEPAEDARRPATSGAAVPVIPQPTGLQPVPETKPVPPPMPPAEAVIKPVPVIPPPPPESKPKELVYTPSTDGTLQPTRITPVAASRITQVSQHSDTVVSEPSEMTFAELSDKYYRSTKYEAQLRQYNLNVPGGATEGANGKVAARQSVYIPDKNYFEQPTAPAPVAARATVAVSRPKGQLTKAYEVAEGGEYLENIAQVTLGNAARAQEIRNLNPRVNQDPVPAGTLLKLPADAQGSAGAQPR